MPDLNVFDKLWFIDVRNLDKNYYHYKANECFLCIKKG